MMSKDVITAILTLVSSLYNQRDVDSLRNEIERKDKTESVVGTRKPVYENVVLEMAGEHSYGVGLMYYEGRLGKNYGESFRHFSDALKKRCMAGGLLFRGAILERSWY